MTSKMKRREFIKLAGLGTGAFMTGTSAATPWSIFNESGKELLKYGSSTATPTYCEICFWKCAGWVHQQNGKPWKIIGNPDDPHSNGRFCPRGTGGIGAYTDPDRLKTPLIRTEERGKQVFREAT